VEGVHFCQCCLYFSASARSDTVHVHKPNYLPELASGSGVRWKWRSLQAINRSVPGSAPLFARIFDTRSHPQAAASGELIPPNTALSVIVHDVGSAAVLPRSEMPDYSSCTSLPPRASRLPGDCKVDWKWRANWRTVGVGGVTEAENRQ